MTNDGTNEVNRGKSTSPASGESSICFAPASTDFDSVVPGRKLLCSLDAGWTSLLVRAFEQPANLEPFEGPTTPDQRVAICMKGEGEVESFSNGVWRKGVYWPGIGAMTAPGRANRLHFQSKVSERIESIYIYIPQYFFSAAADEYRRSGTGFRHEPPDNLGFCDPIISHLALSLDEAIRAGAPNLYAESAAQFLATHLLSLHSKWSEPSVGNRNPGVISDRRLKRVLEYMEHHFAENLSLAQLAREAGISRFHFVRLFREGFGMTPHRHLMQLRMEAAAKMLSDTDLNVQEIALRCGYASAAHFSAAFHRHFSYAPSEYRTRLRASRLDTRL